MIKRIISVAIITAGVLLIMAALALVGYNMWDDSRAGSEMNDVLSSLHDIISTPIITTVDPDVSAPPVEGTDAIDPGASGNDSPTVPSPQTVPDYIQYPDMEMPSVEIGGHRYIGTLSVPVLGLELSVMEEWSYPKLKKSPCRYSGSAYLGNMIIAAHNYTSHFGKLKNLRAGDVIVFTDVEGHVFNYEVVMLETLTTITELESGDWNLTLFTCTVGGAKRVTVRCVSID